MKKPSLRKPTARNSGFIKCLALSSFLILGACDDSAETSSNITNHLKRGESYLQQGQFKAAMIETKNVLQKAPENPKGSILMAQIYNELGQYKGSIGLLEKINSNDPDYVFTKAETFLLLQKYQSALELSNKHAETMSNNDPNRFTLLQANTYLGLQQNQEARNLFEQLIATDSNNADAKLGLTKIHLQKNETSQAEQLLAEIFAGDSDHFDALILHARLQHFQGNLAGAEDSLSNALALLPNTDVMTPKRIGTLRALAEVLTQQGRSAEALLYSKILSEAQPGMDELQQDYGQAITYLKEGKVDEAEALLEKVLAKAPYFEGASQLLGIIKYSKGDIESADKHFSGNIDPETAPEQAKAAYAMTNLKLNKPDAVLELLGHDIENNKNPQTLSLYGIAALAAGKHAEGEKALIRALNIAPKNSRIRVALARHYNDRSQAKPTEGLKQLELAYQHTPKDPLIQSALVQQHAILGQTDKAIQLAEEFAIKYPESETAQVVAGNLNLIKKDHSKARQRYNQALKINADSLNALQGLGRVNIAEKQYDKAQRNFETIIQKAPKNPAGYQGLLGAYELNGKKKQGIDAVNAMANTGKYATPAAILAEYYGRTDQFEEANRYIQSAKGTEPDNLDIRKLAATLAMAEATKELQTGEAAKARNIVMRGLSDSPNDARLLTLLTSIEIKAKNYREASKLIAQVEVDNSHLANLLKANLAEAKGDIQTATHLYQQAWQESPNDFIAGKIYQQLNKAGKEQQANAFLSEWKATLPTSVSALTSSSTYEMGQGRFNTAINELEKALANQKNKSPALMNNLAWAYMETKQNTKALKYSKQAYQAAPNVAAIADTYGWILVQSKQVKEGIVILEKANQLAPKNTEIRQHLDDARKL